MPATTWLNRLTDESNAWFLAVKSEESSRYVDAVIYYLKDATECITKGLPLRSALSCASAASCLEKSGDVLDSSRLYSKAASIYENNSKVVGKELKERLWSLERAYYFSLLAHNIKQASEIHNELLLIQGEMLKPENSAEPPPQKIMLTLLSKKDKETKTDEAVKAVDDFLNMHHTWLEKLQKIPIVK